MRSGASSKRRNRTALSERGIDSPVLAGHSMGGALAIEYAARHETRGLVLMMSGARLRVRPEILALYEHAAQSGSPVPIPGRVKVPRPNLTFPPGRQRKGAGRQRVGLGNSDWEPVHGSSR